MPQQQFLLIILVIVVIGATIAAAVVLDGHPLTATVTIRPDTTILRLLN